MDYSIDILRMSLLYEEYESFLKRIEMPLIQIIDEIFQKRPLNSSMLNDMYSKVLGIGQGSTPQSDDVFLGVMTALSVMNPELVDKLLNLALYRYESFTTKKSANLIRKVLRGNFPIEIQGLVDILKVKSQNNVFQREVLKIKRIGASSGIYFLVGILWQLENYEKKQAKFEREIKQ